MDLGLFSSGRFFSRLVVGMVLAAVPLSAGAGEIRFPGGQGHCQDPVWSADGKWLAFEVNGYNGGSIDLYVASVAGGLASKDATKVTLPGTSGQFGGQATIAQNPTWHPQGPVVFEGSNSGGAVRLYLYQPGGASATELIQQAQVPQNITFPNISKDGNQVVFVANKTGDGDVYTWNRTTNAITQITATDGSESFPMFSPDGKKIVFTRKANNTEDIFEYDIASKTEKTIASGGGDQTRPIYAADDTIVYFSSERGDNIWDVMAVDTAGNKKTLGKDARLPVSARPAVAPDGTWVAWGSNDPQSGVIFLGKVDGSNTVSYKSALDAAGEPGVSTSGGRTWLAYTGIVTGNADYRSLYVDDVTNNLP